MSTRLEQKQHTRRKILDAAYRVYAAQGFSATTPMIAGEAGVSQGSLFVHFSSLQDLQRCLVREISGVMGQALHGLASAEGGIEALARQHLCILAQYEEFYLRLITQQNLLPAEARIEIAGMQSIVAHHFHIVIRREMAQNHLKKLEPSMVFNTWMGLLHYYLENKEMFAPEEPVLARYQETLIRTFVTLVTV